MESRFLCSESLENQFFYPIPKGRKLIFFAPLGAGVNEENQWIYKCKIILPFNYLSKILPQFLQEDYHGKYQIQ